MIHFIYSSYLPYIAYVYRVKFESIFKARNFKNVAGINIIWTSNLVDHLRILEDETDGSTSVAIFHHTSFLQWGKKHVSYPAFEVNVDHILATCSQMDSLRKLLIHWLYYSRPVIKQPDLGIERCASRLKLSAHWIVAPPHTDTLVSNSVGSSILNSIMIDWSSSSRSSTSIVSQA
jgi:hypothetical protein